ncbi:hypothetical protein [Ornithinibacillus halotolerans]|uniref:Lipoprotein n=1 Tax=Ornithinibacillus halotolerans TaxID=1274357 RepID=A0A916S9T0_9BACI|nr:hypothetical protein [Ornithinibacillus halotolerans]GGA87694.1 hypothetical protein GCM10008025_33060 [Ornithinibacillus halotolerans]
MKKLLGIILFLILLAACSNSEPVIVKVDRQPNEEQSEPELVEEIRDEEVDEFIEFSLEDELLRVNLKQIPILDAFLQGSENRQEIIEEMNLERILNREDNDVYLLEFSCNNDQCSYLLLSQNTDNTGHLVADLATFANFSISPDESKLLLRFTRNSKEQYPLSNIIVIDIDKWTILTLHNETITNNIFDFNWPIISASWIDEETITISVPDGIHFESNNQETDNVNEVQEIQFYVK